MEHSATDAFRMLECDHRARSAAIPLEAGARLRFQVALALSQGRVSFDYQPVVRADNPRLPAFYEMLCRIVTPDGGRLPAGAFLPAVEAGPIGRAIDRLALVRALQMLAASPELRLSVNLSPRSMGDEEWLSILTSAYRGNPGACGRLILEVTEDQALADADQTIEFMNFVRRMGPAFALDDFGAGATGFRHFRAFRFDIVKIDGAFVTGIDRDADSQVLLRCLGTLARHFDMMTVAERVETQEEAAWLQEAGIDCLQGYLVGRPTALPLLDRGGRSGGGFGMAAAG